jgi:competence protein ComEC
MQLADESALLAGLPVRADWLAVPHHGSRSSSGALLLDTLGATSAVAQAGYRNRFRHPDPEVVARYHARKIQFFRTDHAGALQWRFASNGTSLLFSTRETEVRYWHNRPGAAPRRAGSGTGAQEVGAAAPDVIPGPPEPYVAR